MSAVLPSYNKAAVVDHIRPRGSTHIVLGVYVCTECLQGSHCVLVTPHSSTHQSSPAIL